MSEPTGPEKSPDRHPSVQAAEDAVRAVLSNDHERLERQFQTIVADAAGKDPTVVRVAWRAFEGELLQHFEDEEVNILPAFAQQRPTEARAIVAEHERIRATLAGLGVDLDLRRLSTERVTDFVVSLRAHARLEDDLLYPWAAHQISNAAADRVRKSLSESKDASSSNSEEWRIDLDRSSLRFSLRHIVVHEIRGHSDGGAGRSLWMTTFWRGLQCVSGSTSRASIRTIPNVTIRFVHLSSSMSRSFHRQRSRARACS